jgi:hypothetical protein
MGGLASSYSTLKWGRFEGNFNIPHKFKHLTKRLFKLKCISIRARLHQAGDNSIRWR